MSHASAQLRAFAEGLISYEKSGNKRDATPPTWDFVVIDRMRPHLSVLMGVAGFRALLSRALALAQEEARWLRAVHVKSEGALEGLEELEGRVPPDEFLEGRIVLVAQFVGLLVAFIGEKLTLKLIRDVRPELLLKDLDFNKGRI